MTELVVEFSPSGYLTDTQLSRLKWIPETGGLREEGLDVLLTKEVRGPWPSLATKEPRWWHLMARVFSVAKAGEPDNNAQTVMALGFRGALLGPRDRGVGRCQLIRADLVWR